MTAPTERPASINVGPLELKNGANLLQTCPGPIASGQEQLYQATLVGVAASTPVTVGLPGDRAFPETVIPEVLTVLPALNITAPTIMTGQATVPAGALDINFDSVPGITDMTILVKRGTDPVTACVLDPAATTFTVPANVIGGAGTVNLEIRIGKVTNLVVNARNVLGISRQLTNVSLDVQ